MGYERAESGILISPATGKRRNLSLPGERPRRSLLRRVVPWLVAAIVVAGGGVGAYLYLGPDAEAGPAVGELRAEAAAAEKAAIAASGRADELAREVEELRAALAIEKGAADKLREAEAALASQADEAAKAEAAVSGAVGSTGEVSRDGDEIHIQLVDKVLFRLGEADLTERGMEVLDRFAVALESLPDRQIWVQGHTDTTPIKPAKGVTPKFTSNWELSAARALTVVHYLQEVGGVDPKRLAAVAFGEHRPASRNKAKNRRIEIVLYPKHTVARR